MFDNLNNNLYFAGFDFSKIGVLEEVRRPLLPPIELETKVISGRDGELYKKKRYGALEIEIDFRVFESIDINKILSMLSVYLREEKLRPLNYRNYKVWYDATLKSVEIVEKYRNRYKLLRMVFYVPSGLGRSLSQIEQYKNFTKGVIRITGTASTYPVIFFEGTNVEISNLWGEKIIIKDGDSHNFIIDCEKEKVFESPTLNLMHRLDWKSEFIMFRPNEVHLTSSKPIDIRFYERYLYDE